MDTPDLIKNFFQLDHINIDSNPRLSYYCHDMEISHNQILSRYMSLNNLINILNGEFYVSKKEYFDDKNEIDAYKIRFCFKEVGEYSIERTEHNLKIFGQAKEISKHLLTSCWTLKKHEDYLMWTSYTDRFNGVMIKAHLNDILSSFKELPLCKIAKIDYQDTPSFDTVDNILFFKTNHFQHEEEVRLYFQTYNMDGERGKIFDIDPSIMIDKIILSPFMKPDKVAYYTKALTTQYPFLKNKINSSEIIINGKN